MTKTKTILKNIHPQFKLVLGSFNITPHANNLNASSGVVPIVYRDFKTVNFKFDGLKPDEPHCGHFQEDDDNLKDSLLFKEASTSSKDRLGNFKVYPNIVNSLVLSQGTADEVKAEVLNPRNFFIVLAIKDQILSFKSFNIDKKLRKTCKSIIYSHLIWNSNRQHFFKRIVS